MSEVTRGDTTIWMIPLRDRDGDPYNLLGCSVWVTVKRNAGESDAEALYQHVLTVNEMGVETVSDGMTLGPGGPEAGIVWQELTPQESSQFEAGAYVYDVQVMDADDRVWTPINGATEIVVVDITRETERPT